VRKIFLLTLIIFLILSSYFYNQNKQEVIKYEIEGQTFELLAADSEDEWVAGLMNVRELDNADGMMFIFPDKQKRTFWNKDTFVDLDVYWILDDKVVGRDFLPSIEKSNGFVYISSPVSVNKVAEIIKQTNN